MITIDPSLFDPKSIPDEIAKFNADLLARINETPDPWTLDHREVRKGRKQGKGVFPFEKPLAEAKTLEIEGAGGPIPIRLVPTSAKRRGAFLHIHGGGWIYGDHDLQDQRLKKMADDTGLDMVSVGYRLAPEDPYPAANDDCERAANWLIENADGQFETGFLAIGGDSAGGHLSATTLLRLRNKLGHMPFRAAVFVAGCFDLRMTPSARNFGSERLILNSDDIEKYSDRYLGGMPVEQRTDPDISPIFDDLHMMPPAHFTVGTRDALMDDSIQMAMRWSSKQADCELEIYPGGCHVFQYFDTSQSQASHRSMAQFLNRQIGSKV